jgi:hypothetical protein
MADTLVTLTTLLGTAVLYSSLVTGFGVGVGVDEARSIDTNLIQTPSGTGPPTWQGEVKNTGSTTMVGRFRLDVRQENRTIYRAWSDTTQVPPGGLDDRTLTYLGGEANQSLEAQLVFHHGAETTHIASQQFQTQPTAREDSGFEIVKRRTYHDRIYLVIDSPPDVEKAHLTVQPTAPRRFEQVTFSPGSGRTAVTVPYTPPIQDQEEVRLRIGDSAGRYYYTSTRRLEPLTGWKATAISLYDSIAAHLPDIFFT